MDSLTTVKKCELLESFFSFFGWARYTLQLLELHAKLSLEQREQLNNYSLQLEQHLIEVGISYSDKLFLELACFEPGMQRGFSDDPLGVLSPKRGGFSQSRLKEASGFIKSAEEVLNVYWKLPLADKHILFGFDANTNLETNDDPIMIFKRINGIFPDRSSRLYEKTLDAYHQLSLEQGQLLAQYAIETRDIEPRVFSELVQRILKRLACLIPGALVGKHTLLATRALIYPGMIFHNADSEARQILIRSLETPTYNEATLNISLLLLALAWIGDEVVQSTFLKWHLEPPAWRSLIYVSPKAYSEEAGWELTLEGKRRNLSFQDCYQLIAKNQTLVTQDKLDNPVKVVGGHEESCHWCGKQLITLFDFDLRSPRLSFLSLQGDSLRIATCERCGVFTPFFTRVDLQGSSMWSKFNVKPPFNGYDDVNYGGAPHDAFVLSYSKRAAFEAFTLESGTSQVGGYPIWIDDAAYPTCPLCQRKMMFIAQVEWMDLKFSDGITYAFICSDCLIAATNYQQT